MSKPKKCENKGKCHKAFKKANDGAPVTPDAENDNKKCCPSKTKEDSKCCPPKPKDGGGCGG